MNVNYGSVMGLYAAPKYHPITCANPAPWKIEFVDLRVNNRDNGIVIMIRCKDSMWFNAKDCYISDREDCQEWIEIQERKRVMDSLYFTIEV